MCEASGRDSRGGPVVPVLGQYAPAITASITQTSPSGLSSTATLTPSAGRPRCRSLLPKPCRIGGLTGGPPLSVHRSTSRGAVGADAGSELGWVPVILDCACRSRTTGIFESRGRTVFHTISTMPLAFDRLPYLAAFVNHKTGEVSLDPLRWGLIPNWCKDPAGGRKPINAKCETVRDLATFRDAYRTRRCILPVDGFFEWKAVKGQKAKQPYAIAMKDGAPFGIAGIWENWKEPACGEWIRTFAIITTNANALVAEIHDRMPVVLAPNDYAR
jgi:SOS response associated peptidase (SRAP)